MTHSKSHLKSPSESHSQLSSEPPSLPPPSSPTRGPIHWLATAGGLGLIRFAPGTFGTLAALPVLWLTQDWQTGAKFLFWSLATLLAIVVASREAQASTKADPSHIVVDEVVGMGFAAYAFDFALLPLLIAFALFRLFDIWKPHPVRLFDRWSKIPSPWPHPWSMRYWSGTMIVLDDVLAGILATVVQLLGWKLFG